MKSATNLSVNLLLLVCLFAGCGQIIKGGSKNIENFLGKAHKNISLAESINNIKGKNELLEAALLYLKEADTLSQNEMIMLNEVAIEFVYFYFVIGDYPEARRYSNIPGKNTNDPFLAVLNCRIFLKEKGKEYAKDAIGILKKIISKLPSMSMARLTLGDSYFLLGNFSKSQKAYTKVLLLKESFQVLAADRLEILDEIRRAGIDTRKVQNIIFSTSVRRDEVADVLYRVFKVHKHIKFGKSFGKQFKDISKSMFSKSISALRDKGFFTYIQGEKFQPFKLVTKSEMAKIIEDYIVLKKGNIAYRTRFLNDKESKIKGIDVKDPYYNAIRNAVEVKIMDISLNGSINALEPISGLKTLVSFGKMTKNFGSKKKRKK